MRHAIPHLVLPEERRLRIIEELERRDRIRVDDVARRFGVSGETVRRDLLDLEERGLLRRVYGGAVRPTPRSLEAPFEERRVVNLARKQAMARRAAELVEPDDTVVLDVGTSVAELARVLPVGFAGRVLTCSLLAAGDLAARDRVEVLTSGGRVRSGDLACSGPVAQDFFAEFFADKAFLGSGGVDPAAGLTDYHLDEIAVRKVILAQARDCYALADSTKIGQVAVGRVCPLSALSGVITDGDADPDAVRALEDAGVPVLVAPLSPPTGDRTDDDGNRLTRS